MIDKTAPDSLQQRPQALALKVEDLLAEVRRGRIRIPPFQRPFRWGRDDAEKLMDSIYLGYPIGTLLLWQTQAPAASLRFGSVDIAAGERADAWFVVDGQQRVTSLIRVLLGSTPTGDDFALHFDLDGQQVLAPSATLLKSQPSRFLPLTEAVDSQRLMDWAFARDDVRDSPARREVAFAFGKRIREYPVAAYVVRSATDSALRKIFGRVNSTGKPMKADEVFDALNGVRSGQRPASFQQIADEVATLGFGMVETRILHRLARVLRGQDVAERGGDEPPELEEEEARDVYARTTEATRRVVGFLIGHAGIPRYELLPYTQPLVTLGWFFHHHPMPSSRSLDLLSRWVWRGALAGTHRGDTVSTRRVIGMIEPGDEDGSVQRLLHDVGERPQSLPDATDRFDFRHARSKLEALALLDLKPRDLESGAVVGARDLIEATRGHEIPPRIFPPSAQDDRPLFASAANRLAHPWRAGLTRRIEALDDEAIRTSHALAPRMPALTRTQQLAARQQRLQQHFHDFFERRARWDESDRPPIASLLVAEETAP